MDFRLAGQGGRNAKCGCLTPSRPLVLRTNLALLENNAALAADIAVALASESREQAARY